MKEIVELPVYWHTSVDVVQEDIKKIKKGKVTELLPSAGGRPIQMIEYGKNTLPKSMASLSSALGGFDYSCYADKTRDDYIPTVFLAGCIHGGEFEGTAALMNLICLRPALTLQARETMQSSILQIVCILSSCRCATPTEDHISRSIIL